MSETLALRVTSVWKTTDTTCIFAGVQLTKAQRVHSAKQIIVVHSHPNNLPILPAVGQHWAVTGDVKEQTAQRHGFEISELHINLDQCEVTLPSDGEQFIRFIAAEPDFKGIGEAKARELWANFGQSIYQVLSNQQNDELEQILTPQSVKSLIAGYQKYANLKHAHWFAARNIPPKVTQRLFKHHGENAVQAIIDDPYRLVTFGLPFDKVDELALKSFGIETGDQRRLQGAVEYSLQLHTSNGHTVAKHDDLKPILTKLLRSSELAGAALLKSHLKGSFILNYELGTFHPTAMLIMEHVIAKRLLNLTGTPTDWHHQHDLAYHESMADIPYPLTTQQAVAVHMAMANSVSCITGGAGTGKTTVLRTVLMAYNQLQFNIKAIALSGRAAMRMHESTGFITSTIARFLREEPLEGTKYLVVVDEASMLDLQTMYRIVTHITPTTRLLFVGDPDQLPPIGNGLILADILKSKSIPNTTLDIVKRQKGSTGIPEYSLLIKQGQMPPQLSTGNIYFHNVPAPLITDTCVELYQHQPDVSQIIGATYQSKNGGIDELNRRCQEVCNRDGRQLTVNFYGEQQYLDIRENDPIIFTQNDYEAGMQNGTLGRLISVQQTEIHFGTVLTDTGQYIQLTQALLDSIRPGYAISLHKAQGSQFQRVIVPITSSKMVDKNWLYTAITRAEVELHLVGPTSLFRAAIFRVEAAAKRQTHLAKLLPS